MNRIAALVACVSILAITAACGQSEPPPDGTTEGVSTGATGAGEVADDLAALVGSGGAAGETQLQALGYTSVGGRNEDGASLTYWRHSGDNACVMVRTVDGRYAAITPATADDCAAAELATSSVAEADSGGYRTVCGVMVDGKPVRYVCSVVAGDQHTAPTTLRFPDQEMTLHWLDDSRVRIEIEGLNPIEGTWSESEGETDLVTPDQTWFYISNREAAAMEVQSMGQ